MRLLAFVRDRRGNVAMMFGLILVPIIGLVGAAIDYSRAADQLSRLQAAVDSTALDLAQSPATTTTADMQTEANSTIRSRVSDAAVLAGLAVGVNRTSNTIQVTASSQVSTSFVSLVGVRNTPIAASSTVEWGNVRLRVALALDVTGSMNSAGKLSAMKTAATNLITQLQNAATNTGDVYVSIVPFAKDVNVGRTNYNQSWLKFGGSTDTWDENNGSCSSGSYSTKSSCESRGRCSDTSYGSQSSCTAAGSCSISGNSSQSSCTSAGYCSDASYSNQNSCTSRGVCKKNNGTTVSSDVKQSNCSYNWYAYTWTYGTWTYNTWAFNTWTADSHSTWTGCVMDRDQSYDTTNTAPGSTAATLFPAEQYSSCPAQLMPLSYDWTTLKSKITSLSAQGGTNQQIGLAWAFQTLTASPFTIPAFDPNYTYNQTIILLSDGLNTQNRFNGNGTTYTSQVDDRQKILCDNIKAAKITIYAVQVNTDSDPTSTVLQYCASGSDKFSMLTSADQIVTTFQSIGTSLTGLRLTH